MIAAAREIIARDGVGRLRITDVTDSGGVGRGSFYNHFGSREDLVAAVVSDSLERLAVRTVADLPEHPDPAVAASASDRRFIRIAVDDPPLARLLVNLAHSDDVFLAAVGPFARRVLEPGLASGRLFVPDLDVAMAVLGGGAIATIRAVLSTGASAGADSAHAEMMLRQFGVPPAEAAEISRLPL
ncbi:Transcriptional regulator TetR family [Patulibacter medicamentivorans]|uniref:Transcriptional regulator TetR family n=2 Tax=Patulibacter medicamentivorans TaxID=1097667 RepID=H0E6L0_9ACTN|nr:Transcriptional regulator TetR family [Patulibacter medicamentivorans]